MQQAILCPGQGAQHVGMGKDFFESHQAARDVYGLADEIIGFPLSALCFHGPDSQLQQTDNAQVAIFVTTVAIYETLKALGKLPAGVDVAAGLSLGEYSALYIAGAIGLPDAIRLVRARGELMQAAAVVQPSTMLALIGADETQAAEICRQAAGHGIVVMANFNAPGQIVLSGGVEACAQAAKVAQTMGVRGVPLNVAGAFHSPFMRPAAEKMREILAGVPIVMPRIAVISNVTARPHESVEKLRELLVEQIVAPVRWSQSMDYLRQQGTLQYLELGPGRVLTGLMKKIDRRAPITNISSADALATPVSVPQAGK